MGRSKTGGLTGLLAVALCTTAAWAKAEAGAAPVRFGISLGGQFPISATAEVQLELPGRFHVTAGGGVMPGAYRRLVNQAAIELGAWPADLGTFAVDHVQQTSVLTGALGWRPFAGKGGFFIELNAARVELSVSAYTAEVMSTFAPGASLELSDGARHVERLNLDLTMDLVGGQIGWMWDVDPVFVRAGIGGLAAVRATARPSVDWSDGSNSSLGLLEEIAFDWTSLFLRNVKVPTATLKLGLRFF
ncbi:MAG: hypothetical protein WBV82_10530 [Myxococcaceae bacterium]